MLYEVNKLFNNISATSICAFESTFTQMETQCNCELEEVWSSYYYDIYTEFPTLGVYTAFKYEFLS